MNRRKHLAAVATMALTTPAVAAACGATATQAPLVLDKSQKDELTWLVWSSDGASRKEAYDTMVKRFTGQFGNVTVNRIAGGGETFEKLIVMMASDTRVDIVGTRPDYMSAYMEGPKPLQNLQTFIKRDNAVIKDKDHAEGVIEGHSWKGGLYALPVGVYTNNIVINQDLFQQNSVPLPKENWTIDELLAAANKITQRKDTEADSIWGFYQHYAAATHFSYGWIRGNGGEPFSPNDMIAQSKWATDVEALNTVQWLFDLHNKIRVMPVGVVGGVWGSFREGKLGIAALETNNLYQIVDAQNAGGAKFKWDVHAMPTMKKGKYQPIGAFAYGISRNTKNPDLTWKLLENIVGPAGQSDWSRLAKFAPSIKSLLNGPYLQDKETPSNKKAIVDAILAAKPMPRHPLSVETDKVVLESLTGIRDSKYGVREGLQDLDRRVTAIITKK